MKFFVETEVDKRVMIHLCVYGSWSEQEYVHSELSRWITNMKNYYQCSTDSKSQHDDKQQEKPISHP